MPKMGSVSGEVNVVSNALLTRLVNQLDKRSSLRRSALSRDEDDQSAMWFALCQAKEIVAITTDQHTAVLRGVFKHLVHLWQTDRESPASAPLGGLARSDRE